MSELRRLTEIHAVLSDEAIGEYAEQIERGPVEMDARTFAATLLGAFKRHLLKKAVAAREAEEPPPDEGVEGVR